MTAVVVIADNTVNQNNANNQMVVTTSDETLYYNTSEISDVTIDDSKITITTSSAEQDVYDDEISKISFNKKSVDDIALSIAYDGTSASVSGDTEYVTISQDGADVTITSTIDAYMEITLSGTTTDGSLLVYSNKKYGITLNGVNITNSDGPAINNQGGKSLYVTLASGTTNTLTDGTEYAEQTYDQKGTLFSEGQLYFAGSGTLTINGNCKNGISSDDYIVFEEGTINVNISSTGSNGIKANDGIEMQDGTVTVNVASDGGRGVRNEGYMAISGGTLDITTTGATIVETTDGIEDVSVPAGIKCDSIFTMSAGSLTISCTGAGARGIKNDQNMEITGGTISITTEGDCSINTINGVADTTSAAGIKCDSTFIMSAGTVTLSSTGDGGKGINCDWNIEVSGGSFTAKTTGSNDEGKPKAVKSDTGIIVSGGSFIASTKKSWAIDNGVDSDTPSDRITVNGSPTTCSIAKKSVTIIY